MFTIKVDIPDYINDEDVKAYLNESIIDLSEETQFIGMEWNDSKRTTLVRIYAPDDLWNLTYKEEIARER
ncbi:hypothetical protein SU69_02050 [Thermosipho melanesiensis]|uniref:Uncharacterized protein n=2 Tax=Thermosipho melanesiensis TaxID=46541 RepID=A6LK10_THEM4|nr:hypothetical protein [Thermosipho melanesiensis]ABR30261.1 hypothetical protein Tmel_0392 [Thermosipho melanesiensis BI429]APT74810.1 hypothetical protein BW47_02135 [Thermosipho melanesiensis]OOC37391.1 hypothetical protein SU68_02060 [Thermosipho melanesiensis]OOC39753.1 hypothetical protein SU69_02050 [Thermosipho melanesiensis]OOC39858.1 hypothetical protein SU70_02045 [Thermosipho melanesiensis]